jgi:hypothetical protein
MRGETALGEPGTKHEMWLCPCLGKFWVTDKSLALSKQFEANAQKDPSNREFDLNQARMLDYQHHIWHEIGTQMSKFCTSLPALQKAFPSILFCSIGKQAYNTYH